MRFFLISVLVAEATAFELCIKAYSPATDCTGSTTTDECVTDSLGDASTCQGTTLNGVTQYYTATCTDNVLSMTQYSTSDCTGSSISVSYTNDQCVDMSVLGSMGYTVDCSKEPSDPCFADTTTACRLNDAAASPATAFKQCFGDEASLSRALP